ncbi:hypothetical protein B7463_g7026, partial [Scytalidium lignicola]
MPDFPQFVSRDPTLQEEIVTAVGMVAQGSFLFAKSQLDSLLRKATEEAIRKELGRLPCTLNNLYKEKMTRISRQNHDSRTLAKTVLLWVIYAKRPPTVRELQHALAVREGETNLYVENIPGEDTLVSVCEGLVDVDKKSSIIHIVHDSAQVYLSRTQETWFPDVERYITTICVTYLLLDSFKTGFCFTDTEFEERLRMHVFYSYAATYWGHHAREASEQPRELILKFLQSDAKLFGSYQAMMAAIRGGRRYSQEVPREMKGPHVAAYYGLREAMAGLLNNRHDLNMKDTWGRTPLMWAVENGHMSVVDLLVGEGASIEARDNRDWTSLILATTKRHISIVDLLLESGADFETRDTVMRTPLSYAAEQGNESIVRLLSDMGVDVNSVDNVGRSPLSYAAEQGNEYIVQLLLDTGADVNLVDNIARSPLSYAVEQGNEYIGRVLLDRGSGVA